MDDDLHRLKIQLISKPGGGVTGTSRYGENLRQGLLSAGVDVTQAYPPPDTLWPPLERGFKRLGLDMHSFFASYPLKIDNAGMDVYHLITQTYATLLMTHRFDAPVVVTVLDIIPFLIRHDPRFKSFRHPIDEAFYRFSLAGLKKASALIAISEYTRRTLIEALGLSGERIHVVYPQTDLNLFRPRNVPDGFLKKYGLKRDTRHILYVGSNDPRKNLRGLVKAFGMLKKKLGAVNLIRVGAEPFTRERGVVQELITQMGLQDSILSFDHVPDQDLAIFYNFADLFVFPSFYEGYGLPVAEAFACGTPVVCSAEASLSEVAGDAARLIDPLNVDDLAIALEEMLEKHEVRDFFRQKGIQQVLHLAERSKAKNVYEVYKKVKG